MESNQTRGVDCDPLQARDCPLHHDPTQEGGGQRGQDQDPEARKQSLPLGWNQQLSVSFANSIFVVRQTANAMHVGSIIVGSLATSF